MKIKEIVDALIREYGEDGELIIEDTICFPNGNVAVFDSKGQVSILQGLLKCRAKY